MTNTKFISDIVKLYKEARSTSTDKKNIRRGRNHSISSKVEDLFAVYISELLVGNEDLPDNFEILIDQPFTYTTDKTYSIYPDIALLKDRRVMKLFDIKMDLGWNRVFYPFCKEKQELMEEIKGLEVKARDGITKEQTVYSIDKDIKYNIVIVSNENISVANRVENENQIANLNSDRVEVFTLTQGVHPNNNDEQALKNIKYLDEDFAKLANEIKSVNVEAPTKCR